LFLLTLIEFEVVVFLRLIARENRKLCEFHISEIVHIPQIDCTKLVVLRVKAHMYTNLSFFIFHHCRELISWQLKSLELPKMLQKWVSALLSHF